MKRINILGIDIEYNKNNIKIKDGYKIKDEVIMCYILTDFLYRANIKYKRSIVAWINEWKAHNFLYNLHLFRKHTKDVDLQENESKFRLLIYEIIGGIL